MISMEVILPTEKLDYKRILDAIEDGLDTAADEVRKDFGKTISTWEHKPTFTILKRPGERTISTADDIYRYVSCGTRVRRVVMTRDFSPKSRYRFVGAMAGSGGVAFGPSKRINRPGIKAREFEITIALVWQRVLPRVLQDALDDKVSK